MMNQSDFIIELADMKKKFRVMFFLAGCIVIGLIVCTALFVMAGYRQIGGVFVKEKTLHVLHLAGIDSCTAGNVRITPWKEITIDSLFIKPSIGNERVIEAVIARCQVQYGIVPVLRFILKNREIILDRTLSQRDSVSEMTKKELWKNALGLVDMFKYSGSRLKLYEKNNPVVSILNYTVDARAGNVFSNEIKGHITADSIYYGQWRFSGVLTDFSYKKNTFAVSDCKGTFLDGTVFCDVSVALDSMRLQNAHAVINGVNIDNYYMILKKYYGMIQGTADITIDLVNSAIDRDSLNGKGVVIARNVSVKNLPVQNAIVSLIGFPQLANIPFDSIVTGFELQNGNKIINKMDGRGSIIAFTANGWLMDDGRLMQQVDGKLTREFVETLPGVISESMYKTPDNGRKFKCKVYGSLDHPKVELSNETLKKAFSGAFDSVKKHIEDVLR